MYISFSEIRYYVYLIKNVLEASLMLKYIIGCRFVSFPVSQCAIVRLFSRLTVSFFGLFIQIKFHLVLANFCKIKVVVFVLKYLFEVQ